MLDEAKELVAAWMRRMGQPVADRPTLISAERLALRMSLMNEELDELNESAKYGIQIETLDGLCDLLYVVLGTACELGLDLDEAFREVHASNMTKSPGNMRGDGKVLKGPEFVPPDLGPILARQMSRRQEEDVAQVTHYEPKKGVEYLG